MRKIIATIVSFLVFFLVTYMLWYIISCKENKNIDIKKLSSIEIADLQGNVFRFVNSDKQTIVVYFKTDCPFCHDEISALSQNIDIFKDVSVFFISSDHKKDIAEFITNFNTSKLTFLYDKNEDVKEVLHVKKYPSIFVFSKDKLIKRFRGAVPVNEIISEMSNE